MKIRSGFVSNSSSSSFVVFCRPISYKDAMAGKYKHLLYGDGNSCDGRDFFQITKEMLDYIKTNGISHKIDFYDVAELSPADGPVKFSDTVREDKDIKVMAIERDYYCTETMETFIQFYGDKKK